MFYILRMMSLGYLWLYVRVINIMGIINVRIILSCSCTTEVWTELNNIFFSKILTFIILLPPSSPNQNVCKTVIKIKLVWPYIPVRKKDSSLQQMMDRFLSKLLNSFKV